MYRFSRRGEIADVSDTEGVVKYTLDYRASALPGDADIDGLFDWFSRCRQRRLIGRDPERYDGYAYGNISVRAARGFVISATQSGGEPALAADRLAWVEDFDIAANRLRAGGPARPSSEAMTHGQVYRALPAVGAVIHVHSPLLWRLATRLGIPVTPPSAAYGTPAMATAVERLLRADTTPTGLFAMGGHEDGVVAYAATIDAAGRHLFTALDRAEALAG